MPGPIDFSNFAKSAADPALERGGHTQASGAEMTSAGVPVTNLYGLRRWRAALADSLNAPATIVVGGDSRVYGENANGSVTFTVTDGRADAPLCFAGQLRSLFAQRWGDPGEGYVFPDGVLDNAVVNAGTGFTFLQPGQASGMLRRNWRLSTAAGTSTLIAAPANVTKIGILMSNHAGEAAGQYQINAGGAVSLGFGTSTDIPTSHSVAVTAGQVLNLVNNAGGNVTYNGFLLQTALAGGVPVHRIGVPGNTIWDWQGGVFNGQVGTYDGSTFYTVPQQIQQIRAMYGFAPSPGLLIVHTGGNEQSNQGSSGGIGCGVTTAIFKAGVQQVVNTAVTDGWCVLLMGPNASGSEIFDGRVPATAYSAVLQGIASTTDHCAYVDINDLWGGSDQASMDNAFNAGLRDHFSAHPTRKGYGDIAQHLYRVLTTAIPVGN